MISCAHNTYQDLISPLWFELQTLWQSIISLRIFFLELPQDCMQVCRMGVIGSFLMWSIAIYVLGYLLHSFSFMMDIHKVIHPHQPGPCWYINGIEHGAEDLVILPNGTAIISAGLVLGETTDTIPSGLYTLNLKADEKEVTRLKVLGFEGSLNPHGLAYHEEDGGTYIYVVNHPPNNTHPPLDVVLKFAWDVDGKVLHYVKTFEDPHFRSINDVLVVGKDQFYVSNMWIFLSSFMKKLESMLLFWLPLQNVLYFDGTAAKVVLNGAYGANGINTSPDGKFLYLSEANAKRISSYEILGPGKLQLVDRMDLATIPDNIDVQQETGDLWIGTHPVGMKIMTKHDLGSTAASQVIRVSVRDGKFISSRQVFADDGTKIQASSVAAFYGGKVIVGSVDSKALICKCLAC